MRIILQGNGVIVFRGDFMTSTHRSVTTLKGKLFTRVAGRKVSYSWSQFFPYEKFSWNEKFLWMIDHKNFAITTEVNHEFNYGI